MPGDDDQSIPAAVLKLLHENHIGYLSLSTKKGDLYSYPIAYLYSGENVYFVTPIASAKAKFLKANPKVSLIVDNRKLTLECVGAMIQGDTTIFSIAKTLKSIVSVLPKTISFSKKYPRMFAFYAKGKDLPDERKIYKYRFIKINIKKILFWEGYKFGRFIPKKSPGMLGKLFHDLKSSPTIGENALDSISQMLESSDEDIDSESPVAIDDTWLDKLSEGANEGGISEDERRIINMFAKTSMENATKTLKEGVKKIIDTKYSSKVSSDERSILEKWKKGSDKS
jgi:uncharacterized pyridoxamine 5'-phosphate oxidase family protein